MATAFQKYPCKCKCVNEMTFTSGTHTHILTGKKENQLIGSGTTTEGFKVPEKKKKGKQENK